MNPFEWLQNFVSGISAMLMPWRGKAKPNPPDDPTAETKK